MTFTTTLQDWFIKNQRKLPFRLDKDPYRVWISEIMAQQTQIDTMIPYFERWMSKWPTIKSLFEASENDLLKAWEGLGYYTRVRNIHKAAQQLSQNNYIFPNTIDEIRALPGIGPYTAAAIASICFESKSVAIDGNVNRVVSRLFEFEDDFGSPSLLNKVTEKMEVWMSSATPSVFTQAMMELGALICTPKNPSCDQCPLKQNCLAFKNQSTLDFPKKKITKKKPELHKLILLMRHKDLLALTLDHQDSLMKGYWRFPEVKELPKESLYIGSHHHVFTHLIWDLDFYSVETEKSSEFQWFSAEEIEALPLITAHRVFFEKTKTRIFSSES
ncbi:MAG: A/G-specific adenine glycosylase [Erysipelotrichaceae bacterium]|nr:A/G-specific adenine glycosylase [Erysipelotrichaceae bacterium]